METNWVVLSYEILVRNLSNEVASSEKAYYHLFVVTYVTCDAASRHKSWVRDPQAAGPIFFYFFDQILKASHFTDLTVLQIFTTMYKFEF